MKKKESEVSLTNEKLLELEKRLLESALKNEKIQASLTSSRKSEHELKVEEAHRNNNKVDKSLKSEMVPDPDHLKQLVEEVEDAFESLRNLMEPKGNYFIKEIFAETGVIIQVPPHVNPDAEVTLIGPKAKLAKVVKKMCVRADYHDRVKNKKRNNNDEPGCIAISEPVSVKTEPLKQAESIKTEEDEVYEFELDPDDFEKLKQEQEKEAKKAKNLKLENDLESALKNEKLQQRAPVGAGLSRPECPVQPPRRITPTPSKASLASRRTSKQEAKVEVVHRNNNKVERSMKSEMVPDNLKQDTQLQEDADESMNMIRKDFEEKLLQPEEENEEVSDSDEEVYLSDQEFDLINSLVERERTCPHCRDLFRDEEQFEFHVFVQHSPETDLKCSQCGLRFISSDHEWLKRHEEIPHCKMFFDNLFNVQ